MTDTPMTPDNPAPVELTEQQLEALIDVGNRALNDRYHEDQCHCDAWPTSCVSSGHYFMGAWDTNAFAIGVPAVLGLWESLRNDRHAAKIAELRADNEALRARVAELEAAPPSRFSATPVQIDTFLRASLAEDTYLRFQQTIGEHVLGEAVEDAGAVRASADNDGLYNTDWREGWDDAIERVDPDRNDPCPTTLITFSEAAPATANPTGLPMLTGRARHDARVAAETAPRDLRPGAEMARRMLRPGACDACGDIPDEWCPTCAACRTGCHSGHDGNDCAHPNAPWKPAP